MKVAKQNTVSIFLLQLKKKQSTTVEQMYASLLILIYNVFNRFVHLTLTEINIQLDKIQLTTL